MSQLTLDDFFKELLDKQEIANEELISIILFLHSEFIKFFETFINKIGTLETQVKENQKQILTMRGKSEEEIKIELLKWKDKIKKRIEEFHTG